MKGENSVWASDSRWHSVWPLFSTAAVVVVTSTKTRSPLLLRSLVTPLSSPCCKKKNEKERSFLQFSLVHWMAGIGGWNKKKKKKMDNRSLKEGYKSDLGPNLSCEYTHSLLLVPHEDAVSSVTNQWSILILQKEKEKVRHEQENAQIFLIPKGQHWWCTWTRI